MVDINISLGLWFCTFLFAAFCVVCRFVSLEGFWLFLVTISNVWHGFLCAVDSTALHFLEYALLALWLATIRIFATSLSYLVTTAEFIKQVTSIFQRLRTQWERRQWERRTCESIIRKQLSKPVVHKRPSPQHSTTPLFQRGVNHDIYALFLPEELPTEEVTKTISPIPFQHMYDPRMFNHVRKIHFSDPLLGCS